MRFYNGPHRHYCGIDLHAKSLYVCILDTTGKVLVHRNVKVTPAAFLEVVAPYRDGLVVAAECTFTGYWLADLCAKEGIAFVLGHALAMKAIHGGKAVDGKKLLARLERKHGNGKALSILAHKIGRAVYYILARGTVYSHERFMHA